MGGGHPMDGGDPIGGGRVKMWIVSLSDWVLAAPTHITMGYCRWQLRQTDLSEGCACRAAPAPGVLLLPSTKCLPCRRPTHLCRTTASKALRCLEPRDRGEQRFGLVTTGCCGLCRAHEVRVFTRSARASACVRQACLRHGALLHVSLNFGRFGILPKSCWICSGFRELPELRQLAGWSKQHIQAFTTCSGKCSEADWASLAMQLASNSESHQSDIWTRANLPSG